MLNRQTRKGYTFTSINRVELLLYLYSLVLSMSDQPKHFTVEKRILVAMRKTLSSVVKDVTPSSSALKSPLTDATIEDIKMCFGMIAAREQEIAKEAGVELNERPQYTDQEVKSNVVSLDSLTKK